MSIPGMASPCVICRDPRDGMKRERLREIEELCSGASDDRHRIRASFEWGLRTRCRYGIPCQKLSQFDSECRMTAGRIERKLVDAVLGSADTYRRIYGLCRGYFPQVCREIEMIRAKAGK